MAVAALMLEGHKGGIVKIMALGARDLKGHGHTIQGPQRGLQFRQPIMHQQQVLADASHCNSNAPLSGTVARQKGIYCEGL